MLSTEQGLHLRVYMKCSSVGVLALAFLLVEEYQGHDAYGRGAQGVLESPLSSQAQGATYSCGQCRCSVVELP